LNISVVIIARNEERRIRKTLQSLQKQTLLPNEVIVVDNASTDSTAKIARGYGATVVYEPITVRGKARNTGFLATKSEFLGLCDADFLLDPNWLKLLYQRISSDKNVGGVSGSLLALNKEKLIPHLIELSSQTPRVGNAVMMYRRQAVLQAGLWNPKLHNAEDVELAWRILKSGYIIVYEPGAKAYHPHPEELPSFLKRQYQYGYWSMLAKKSANALTTKERLIMFLFPFIFIKHLPKAKLHPVLPIFLTLSTYAYTLGMWKSLAINGLIFNN
jgi:glycosyltransferase involved in cell wall biosynthesis